MYGAILGDIIGSPYEFDRGKKTKDFPLFDENSHFTDDTVMTIAVAEGLLKAGENSDDTAVRREIVSAMRKWGRKYPGAGYGGRFIGWLLNEGNPQPYGSYGNGSAMRVSAAGWLYDTIEKTRKYARLTADVSHNHPEGIKGAEATASVIFLARTGSAKDVIKEYVTQEFGYDLSRTCDEIRPKYHHVESCQETVPEAIIAFLEGESFEDVIRTAVSLGGDCDTLTCIAGGMAEAFYGVPEGLKEECRERITDNMLTVLDEFEEKRNEKKDLHDPFPDENQLIEEAIAGYYKDGSDENLTTVLDAIRRRMHADGCFLAPIASVDGDDSRFMFRSIRTSDGKSWFVIFTSREEYAKGAPSETLSCFISSILKTELDSGKAGFIINPWGDFFLLTGERIAKIFEMDGGIDYSVPDVLITPELLEDGSFLKKAIGICNRNRTGSNLIRLTRILRDSWVWVPCNAVFSDADKEAMNKTVLEVEEKGDPESLVGKTFTNQDTIRMVPDILQNSNGFFFPVFTSKTEMGEYGERFSKIQSHFLQAVNLARNNEKEILGVVINAFTEPFIVPREMFELIIEMDSSIEGKK